MTNENECKSMWMNVTSSLDADNSAAWLAIQNVYSPLVSCDALSDSLRQHVAS